MEQQFSFFQALVMSFYSRRLYRDIYTSWQRSRLFYTLQMAMTIIGLMLAFILFFILKINLDPSIRNWSNWLLGETPAHREMAVNRLFTLISTMPNLEYKHNELSTGQPAATVIHDPVTHYALFTINTTGKPAPIPYRHLGMYPTITSHTIGLNNEYIPLTALADEETIQNIVTIINQFPSLTLLEGRLLHTGSNPFIIEDASKHPLVVINTSGTYDPPSSNDSSLALLTDTTLFFRLPSVLGNHHWIEKKWKDLNSEDLYHALSRLVSTARFIMMFAVILTAPIFILCLFSIFSCIVLFYSLQAWLLARYLPSLQPVPYQRCITLSAVALTPVFFLSIFLHPATLLEGVLVYGVVASFYIYFALKAAIPKGIYPSDT